MSSIKNPVGPQPPSVYWRRRVLLALGLIAVIVVIILIVVQPGSGGTADPKDDTPAAGSDTSDPPTDAATDEPEVGGACAASSIELTPVTDATSYGADAQPMISMSIKNTGTVDCTLEAGTGAQEYVIMSGSDRIWSSKDCQTDPTTAPTLIAAGETKSTTPFAWGRTRSAE